MSWQDDPIAGNIGTTAPRATDLWKDDPIIDTPSIPQSLGHAAVNNFPLGGQAAALVKGVGNDKGYSQNLEDWNKQTDIDKKAHPVAYGTGAVAGALAPLAIPGVGEALEAAPFAGNAIYGAANAVGNTNLIKNPGETVKKGVKGAVIGGTVGKVADALMPGTGSLENLANNKAVENIGLPTKYLSDLNEKEYEALGPYIRESGLVGTDKTELLKNALSKQKEFGENIGSIGKELTDKGITASDDDILKAVESLKSKAAETESLENPELRKMAIWHNKGANDILNKISEDPSWSSIQKLKQAYGKAAFDGTGEIKNEASKNVYFTLRDMLGKLTEKAQTNPNLPNEYKQALLGYHRIDPIVEGLSGFVGRERAGVTGHGLGHGFFSRIIRSLPGQSNPKVNLATAAAATAFSPHLGPIMALPTLTNPAVQSKAASALANKLPGIQQGLTQEMTDYLESKFGKKE